MIHIVSRTMSTSHFLCQKWYNFREAYDEAGFTTRHSFNTMMLGELGLLDKPTTGEALEVSQEINKICNELRYKLDIYMKENGSITSELIRSTYDQYLNKYKASKEKSVETVFLVQRSSSQSQMLCHRWDGFSHAFKAAGFSSMDSFKSIMFHDTCMHEMTDNQIVQHDSVLTSTVAALRAVLESHMESTGYITAKLIRASYEDHLKTLKEAIK